MLGLRRKNTILYVYLYCKHDLLSVLQGEVGWALTRRHVEIQYTFLSADAVPGSAAVGARCAGRCVPHVNGASHWICRQVREHINEEVKVENSVWDRNTICFGVFNESPLPITAELGSTLPSLVFSQLYCSGLVPSLDMHLSTMSLPSSMGPSA